MTDNELIALVREIADPETEDPHDANWGWKRRCDDFKPMVPVCGSSA